MGANTCDSQARMPSEVLAWRRRESFELARQTEWTSSNPSVNMNSKSKASRSYIGHRTTGHAISCVIASPTEMVNSGSSNMKINHRYAICQRFATTRTRFQHNPTRRWRSSCRWRPSRNTATKPVTGCLRQPCCITLSLLIMVALTFAAHTFELGSGQQQKQQPQRQQVDARLISQTADNGKPGKHQENLHWNITKPELSSDSHLEGAKITKRFAATATQNSADMPAEFRAGDLDVSTANQPREQSRLAKLCQQTSSVLASVLPAPFGGHKRSILCQFFGQVHVGGGGKRATPAATYPINAAAILPPEIQFPGGQLVGNAADEPDSIAILHQNQQSPVAMLATGKHPIQMVLEHHRQSALSSQGRSLPIRMPMINPHLIQTRAPPRPQQQFTSKQTPNLGGANSFQMQHPQPQQQQQQQNPAQKLAPLKFSAPLATSPAVQVSTNSSGWRIFNVTLFATSQGQTSSTTPMPKSSSTTTPVAQEIQSPKSMVSTSSSKPNTKDQDSQQARVGKRTSETPPIRSTAASADKSELAVAESRQAPESMGGDVGLDGVRTIEVVAQNAPISNLQQHGGSVQTTASPPINRQQGSSNTKPDTVQKREEMVIASINNLTRIAFGNQLRDTVKVINKLIDQQAELFNDNSRAQSRQHKMNSHVDPMQTSESISKGQVALMMVPLRPPDRRKLSSSKPRKLAMVDSAEKPEASSSVGAGKQQDQIAPIESKRESYQHQRDQSKATKWLAPSGVNQDKVVKKQAATLIKVKSHPESRETSAVAKSTPKMDKIAGHSKNVNNDFSSNRSTSTTTRSTARPTAQSSSILELRRLTTIGRSLLEQSSGPKSTRRPTSTTKSARNFHSTPASRDDMELMPAESIRDLRRDPKGSLAASSIWLPSSGPTRPSNGNKSRSPAMRKLRDEFARSPAKSNKVSLTTKRTASTSVATGSSTSLPPPASPSMSLATTVTQFSWLLPDRSAIAEVDLSGSSSAVSDTAQLELRSSAVEVPKKWTTRRMITPYGSDLFSSMPTKGNSDALNGIGQKLDSLTTLKMAVTNARTAQTSTEAKSPPNQQATRPTPLPFSSGISAQSRWIPSTIFVGTHSTSTAQPSTTTPAMTSTTSSSSTTTTTTSTTTTTTPQPQRPTFQTITTTRAPTTIEIIANSYGSNPSTVSLSDLNEAKASESISKYTTHLNEANELIATTKRHFQYPLPQIANAGDFFSAETIASWPEKYETMISRAMEMGGENSQQQTSKMTMTTTTNAFETTRRNGESYDQPANESGPSRTMLARHRLDESTQTASSRPIVVLGNTPGITILPSNHKLGSPAASESNGTPEITAATLSVMQTTSTDDHYSTVKESPSSFAGLAITTQTKQLPPYTLIDQLLASSGQQPASSETTNQSTTPTDSATKYFSLTNLVWPSQPNGTNSSTSDLLRPPYQDNYDHQLSSEFQLSDPTLVLDQAQSRPHVSRKLYELFVPPTRNFVGSQNPLNRQRFNWSALKYLAQNILTSGRYSAENSTRNLNSSEPLYDANQFSIDGRQQNGNGTQQRLNDLMTKASYAPTNYYELSSNDSSLMWPLVDQDDVATNQQQTNSTISKGIFERASNLLSEMKQMEQKRAAAILAAFRYQVPGPLVRPWDMASDLQSAIGRDISPPSSSPSISRFVADRFDGSDGKHLNHRDSVHLPGTLKSALFKQKLVARDELEARLKRRGLDRSSPSARSSIWRRNDPVQDIELAPEAGSPPRNTDNSTVRLEDLEYVLAQNETGNVGRESNAPGLQTMIDKLPLAPNLDFGSTNSSVMATTNSSNQAQKDFDLIDLSSKPVREPNQVKPKYIRVSDYQTALDRKPLDEKAKRLFAPAGTRQQVVDVLAKSRSSSATSDEAVTVQTINLEQDTQIFKTRAGEESDQNKPLPREEEFYCDGRSAGFYPDATSSCRNFYHCSNTGHLLTFNCPSSTRFDQKSLKCGPWYEVPCDIGRVRMRRY